MMEEEMIEPITASQIIDDEYIEIDVEIYRVDRSNSVDDYVVLKINEAETYMSIEDAKNIASMLNDVASEVNSDGVS
jgi:hydrogenase maturation factor